MRAVTITAVTAIPTNQPVRPAECGSPPRGDKFSSQETKENISLPPVFHRVVAFEPLAENVCNSVHKRCGVVVVGTGVGRMTLDRARSLTAAQVAMICGVTQSAVRNWIQRGHIRRNRHGRIEPPELLRYLDKRGSRGQHKNARRYDFRPSGAKRSAA
jgi:hypothetical protein